MPFKKGVIPWNKGLTKETDERLAIASDLMKRTYLKKELPYMNKEWLEHYYIELRMSTKQIEKETGYRAESIRIWLHKFNIPVRTDSQSLIGHKGWNKGLRKETDSRVAQQAETCRSWWTDERRQHQSEVIGGQATEISKRITDMWSDPETRQILLEKFSHRKSPHSPSIRRPTGAEQVVYDYVMFHEEWEYTGDGTFWFTLEDGRHKNPDFMNMSRQRVIEVFGDYWHTKEEVEPLINAYRDVEWECFVIWESELKNIGINSQFNEFIEPREEYENYIALWND